MTFGSFTQIEKVIAEEDHITRDVVFCPDCDRVHTDQSMVRIESNDGGVEAICTCGNRLIRVE